MANMEGENLKYSLAVLRGDWQRERDRLLAEWKEEADSLKGALAALKSSEEDISALVREHRVRFSEVRLMEERAAACLKEPRKLAEEYKRELEKNLESAFSQLSVLRDARIKDWEADLRGRLEAEIQKLSNEISAEKEKHNQSFILWRAEFYESLKKAISAGHASLDYETRKFKDALALHLNASTLTAGKAIQAESAELRKEFSRMAGKFSAVVDSLIRELKEKAGAELKGKLAGEMPSVYAGIRAALEKETADKIKKFADLAAAELEAGRRVVLNKLQPGWEKLSSGMTAQFNESLREFNKKKQDALEDEVRKFGETLVCDLKTASLEAGKAVEAESVKLRGDLARETQKFSADKDSVTRELNAAAMEAAKAIEAESAKLRGELARETEKFAAATDSLIRELKEKAGAELEGKLAGEMPSVYAGIRAALEKESADKIKKFADLAAAELEAGRRVVLNKLQPGWEKLSSGMTAQFNESLREFNKKKQDALEDEVRKFGETLVCDLKTASLEAGKAIEAEGVRLREDLARETQKFSADKDSVARELNAAAMEAAKAIEAESAKLRGDLARETEKFAAATDALIRELKEKAGAELEGKLAGEMPSVYAGIRAALEKEAAAELEAGRRAVLKELQPGWEKLSSGMTAQFNESLREFKRRKEEDFSKALSEQTAELEFLSRETREKMESVSSEFLVRTEEMKSWLEQTAGELAKAREAAGAAGAKGAQAQDGGLGERIMELERKITKEMLNRKEGAVRSEIPVIIGTQKGAQRGSSTAPGAVPLYRESHSLRDNFTLAAALVAALLSVLSLLAK